MDVFDQIESGAAPKRDIFDQVAPTKRSGLLGGENAEIKSAPGFLTNLSQALTAPFNQERAPVAADQPRPGMFGRALESATAAGKGILGLANAPFETIAPTVTKYAGENLPITPQHAEAIGNAVGAVAQGSILPWRSRAPLAPARNIEDLIAAPRPALPAPPEQLGLPPPTTQPQLSPPKGLSPNTVFEGSQLQTPGGATMGGPVSQAPKRTIVDLIDEVKQDVKQQVIDEIFQELKSGRPQAAAGAPKQTAPLSIEDLRGQIAPEAQATTPVEKKPWQIAHDELIAKKKTARELPDDQADARRIFNETAERGRANPAQANELELMQAYNKTERLLGQAETAGDTGAVDALRRESDYLKGLVKEKRAAPTFEKTLAGDQGVIPGAEARTIPQGGLRPKRRQTEAPLELEQPALRAQEPELALTKEAAPVEKKPFYAETGARNMAQRITNAENRFIEFAMDRAGLTQEQAQTALEKYKAVKVIKIDPIGGQFTFKYAGEHAGGFADPKVLRRAAGLEEAAVEGKVPFDVPGEAATVTDPAQVQEIRNSIAEGEQILRSGKKVSGVKMTEPELQMVKRSVDNSKTKIGEPGVRYSPSQQPESPRPVEMGTTVAGEAGNVKGKAPTPTPASQLAPEESAAQQEMRGMLGGKGAAAQSEPITLDKVYSNLSDKVKTLQEKRLAAETAYHGGPDKYVQDAIDKQLKSLNATLDEFRQKGLDKPRTIGDLLKGESGQIGSTETNPIVTGTRLAMGEAVEQSGKTVRKTMGPEGNDLIDRLTNVRNNTERNTGIQSQPLEDAIKKIKREHYENFADVLEGKAAPASQEVANAVSIADKVRKNIAERAEAVDLQIKNPLTGEYTPFRPREDYFPHYSKEQFSKVVENPTARADIKAQIKEQLGPNATDKQAEDALKSMIKNSKRRDAHLEIARVIDLPDYHKDPRVFLKYINDANRRIAIADQFGPKLEQGEELLSAIGQNHGDKAESFARTLFNRELRMEEVPDTMAHRMMQGARNYEVLTKLGRAFIPNMSQHAYTGIVTNTTDMAKGIAKAFTKEGKTFARRAGVVNDEVLKEFYNEVTGASTGDSLIHRAIGIELKPFTWSEKLNRTAAANAGRYYANETFDALQASPAKAKLRDTLSKMGIDVDAALKNGALSSTDELKAAQNIVNRSQFKVDPMELPLFWSSPEGKLLTQFKSFNFKSGQFMKDEILKEAAKGNIGPLARAAALLPPAGYTVSKIQNALRSGSQDDKNSIADYLATVGVLGIFSDLVRNGGRMDTSTIAGPTLSDVGKGLEAVSQTKQRLSDDYTGNAPAWGPLAKFAARQVPVVGSNLAAMFNEPKSERQQLLDQLGIKDDRDKERKQLIKKLGLQH